MLAPAHAVAAGLPVAPISSERLVASMPALLVRLGLDGDDELTAWAGSMPAATSLAEAWEACDRPDAMIEVAARAGVCGRKILWALERVLRCVVIGPTWYATLPYLQAITAFAIGDYSREARELVDEAAREGAWSTPWVVALQGTALAGAGRASSAPARCAVRDAAATISVACSEGWSGDGPLPREAVIEACACVDSAVEAIRDDEASARAVAGVVRRWLPWRVVDAALAHGADRRAA